MLDKKVFHVDKNKMMLHQKNILQKSYQFFSGTAPICFTYKIFILLVLELLYYSLLQATRGNFMGK